MAKLIRDEILLKKVVENLKRLREQHNISQEIFYNETNINIARIESMKANISLSTFRELGIFTRIAYKYAHKL